MIGQSILHYKILAKAQLINVADGYHLWSESFEESTVQNIFVIKEIDLFGRKPVTLALLAYAYNLTGKVNEALKLRDELEEQLRHT